MSNATRCAFGWLSRCENQGTHTRDNGVGKSVWACDEHKDPRTDPESHWYLAEEGAANE